MLGPQDRRLLLDALRPPEGYSLDIAIGTTYSLDLLALLTAPLAFALFDWQDADGRPNGDPLATLEALRRYADRIAVFCQAGQILVPKQHRILFEYLEGSIFEVTPPSHSLSFHPKVWALRFTSADEPVRYRLLCLSRNLTFDRSWDTALVLDGVLSDRKNAFAENHPLGEFVEALPVMTVRSLRTEVRSGVEECGRELRRVKFEPPEGFDQIAYWPLGLPSRKSWPFRSSYSRLAVVSPFLSDGTLDRLAASAGECFLISRLESLQQTGTEALSGFSAVYSLSPSADVEDAQVDTSGTDEDNEPVPHEDLPLSGLHAKLFIAEYGWDASVFTGSANATSAAFGGNVEFLVELVGKKSRVGIDAFLKKADNSVSFSDLLEPYDPDTGIDGLDPLMRRLEECVDGVRRLIAGARLWVDVSQCPGQDIFDATLRVDADGPLEIPAGVRVKCWPITLAEAHAAAVAGAPDDLATFRRLSFQALTSFVAFDLLAEQEGRRASARFTLNLPLVGAPTDRRDRILRALLNSPEQVLRFLMFLLSEFGVSGVPPERAGEVLGGNGHLSWGSGGLPLFESLLKALSQNPSKLDQVASLVEDLRCAGEDLLPRGFDKVWQPVWEARQRVGS